MAFYECAIDGSGSVTIDGEKVINKMAINTLDLSSSELQSIFESEIESLGFGEAASISTLPYGFAYGCAVIYNNEIHILGGNATSPFTQHYNITSKKTVIPYFAKKLTKLF